MADHTMAHGATVLQSRRRLLGAIGGVTMIPPCNRLFAIFFAPSGSGKSTLLQSNPGTFYINIDASSTVVPRPPSFMWPAINPDNGLPVEACEPKDPEGFDHPKLGWVRPCELTWPKIRDKVREVIVYTKEHPKDCPVSSVTFDTVSSAIPLMMDYDFERFKQRNPDSAAIESWNDIKTLDKWSGMYDEFVSLTKEIRRAGLGVILAIHLTDKFVTLDDKRKEFVKNAASISDAFKGRLVPEAELVGILELKEETTYREIPAKHPVTGAAQFMPDGVTPKVNKIPLQVVRGYVHLNATHGGPVAGARGVTPKGRAISGSVALDKADAWGCLERAYREGAESLEAQ
jgi:hypothetical protein